MSQKCQALSEEILKAMISGKEFPGREAAERHVEECSGCQKELAALRRHGEDVARFMYELMQAEVKIDQVLAEKAQLEGFDRYHRQACERDSKGEAKC